jgi:hypothetical protein
MRAGLSIVMFVVLLAVRRSQRRRTPPPSCGVLRQLPVQQLGGDGGHDCPSPGGNGAAAKVLTRGEDDALVRFIAPAKDAGNATLKLGRRPGYSTRDRTR